MEDGHKLSSGSREPTSDGSLTGTNQNAASTAPPPKKGKAKKSTDPADASKQIAAKIAQLEQDAAGEKDMEAEIGM